MSCDHAGDCPEAVALLAAAGFSIRQHAMAAYLRSLSSICIAQCMQHKGLPDGRQGVEGLARSPQLQTYFGTLSGPLPFQKHYTPGCMWP